MRHMRSYIITYILYFNTKATFINNFNDESYFMWEIKVWCFGIFNNSFYVVHKRNKNINNLFLNKFMYLHNIHKVRINKFSLQYFLIQGILPLFRYFLRIQVKRLKSMLSRVIKGEHVLIRAQNLQNRFRVFCHHFILLGNFLIKILTTYYINKFLIRVYNMLMNIFLWRMFLSYW